MKEKKTELSINRNNRVINITELKDASWYKTQLQPPKDMTFKGLSVANVVKGGVANVVKGGVANVVKGRVANVVKGRVANVVKGRVANVVKGGVANVHVVKGV